MVYGLFLIWMYKFKNISIYDLFVFFSRCGKYFILVVIVVGGVGWGEVIDVFKFIGYIIVSGNVWIVCVIGGYI